MAYPIYTKLRKPISKVQYAPLLGEQFISPKKPSSQRHKSSRKRKNLSLQYEPVMKQPNTSSGVTHEPAASDTITSEVYSTPVGETLATH